MKLTGSIASQLPQHIFVAAEMLLHNAPTSAYIDHLLHENSSGEILLRIVADGEAKLLHTVQKNRNIASIYTNLSIEENRSRNSPLLQSIGTVIQDNKGVEWEATLLRYPRGATAEILHAPSLGDILRDDRITIYELQDKVKQIFEMLAHWQGHFILTPEEIQIDNLIKISESRVQLAVPISTQVQTIRFDAPPGLNHPMRNPAAFALRTADVVQVLLGTVCRSISADTILMSSNPTVIDWSVMSRGFRFYEWARLELEIIENLIPPDNVRGWTEFCYAVEGALRPVSLDIDEKSVRGRLAPASLSLITKSRDVLHKTLESISEKVAKTTYFLSALHVGLERSLDMSFRPNIRLGALFYAARALECLKGNTTETLSHYISYPNTRTRQLSFQNQMVDAHALIMGVGTFQRSDSIAPLPTVLNDVRNLSSAFQGAGYETTTFLNSQVTKYVIQRELERYRSLPETATLLIYFGGHGFIENNKYYLALSGADKFNISGSCLEWNEIIIQLRHETMRAQRVMILLDTCHSGAASNSIRDLSSPIDANRLIFSACDINQRAVSLPGRDHGLFTEAILESLAGVHTEPSEHINLFSFIDYITRQVVQRSENFSHVQKPTFLGEIRENFRIV